jgi:hypothetical protein
MAIAADRSTPARLPTLLTYVASGRALLHGQRGPDERAGEIGVVNRVWDDPEVS